MFVIKPRVVVALFLITAIHWGAFATTLARSDLRERSLKSELVVYGVVESVAIDSGRRYATLNVKDVVRGQVSDPVIRVELLQRASRDQGWVERVPGSVELFPGEDVLLFLKFSQKKSQWVPLYLERSKYRVVKDSYGVRRALSWADAKINQVSVDDLSSARSLNQKTMSVIEKNPQDLQAVQSLNDLINQVRSF